MDMSQGVTPAQGTDPNQPRIFKAAVIGASGYAGGELLDLISKHPSLDLHVATANTNVGAPITELHPKLTQYSGQSFSATTADAVAGADVIFLALPHGESAAFVGSLGAMKMIVDLGADFRLESESEWQRYYPGEHAGTWVYGLPEAPNARAAIAAATQVANPGCYATAIALGSMPLVTEGLVAAIDVVGLSGTSGAGRTLRNDLLASEVMGSLAPYKVGGVHQHTPEIAQTLGKVEQNITVSFTPVLAPLDRGILAVITATPLRATSAVELQTLFEDFYTVEPFVQVMPAGKQCVVKSVVGTNNCQISVAFDERANRIVVTTVIDNLVKGAAGQAIQNFNLMAGLPETAGLK
jgi:N-acetyl-gamma-glutamyl-phosphate reductase